MKLNIWISAILTFAVILRVVDTNSSPPALYGDELTIALDANSILKTGKDQLGNPFPLTFQMGAGRPAGYVYGSIPFIALFGTSALGVRALSIASGIGIVILSFYIGKKLFSKKVGLIAALVAAVSPWDISLSRGGFEAHFALFLAVLAFYLFIKVKEKPIFYIFSALSFGLTLHTYPTYKVSLPLFLPLLFWFQGGKSILANGKKYFLAGVFVLLILGLLSISQTFIGGSEKRFSNINVLSQEKLKDTIEQKINFERSITNLPKSLQRYFHNKGVEYAKVIGENYLQNFSVDFLILHGDRNPRHNMGTTGEIYFVEAILILVGLIYFWQKYKKTILFLLIWLILAPIPTAFVDTPHALRSSFMLPPLILLASLGLTSVLASKSKILFYTFGILFIIQFIFFIYKLHFLAPNEYSRFWSYSAKMASEIAIQSRAKYDYIILSDQIDSLEFAYPVYAKIEPSLIISQNQNRTNLGNFQFKKMDNVYLGFIPDGEVEQFIETLDGSALYIGLPSVANFLKDVEIVESKDGSVALVLKRK